MHYIESTEATCKGFVHRLWIGKYKTSMKTTISLQRKRNPLVGKKLGKTGRYVSFVTQT